MHTGERTLDIDWTFFVDVNCFQNKSIGRKAPIENPEVPRQSSCYSEEVRGLTLEYCSVLAGRPLTPIPRAEHASI